MMTSFCCASCCSCSLSSLFLAKLQSETTLQSIAQQQQIEEIVATELITERPNGACSAEMSTTRAYERAQFIRPQAVCLFHGECNSLLPSSPFYFGPEISPFLEIYKYKHKNKKMPQPSNI
jgi:hypothetical protein